MSGPDGPEAWLGPWCREHLGASPVTTLLSAEAMSSVVGLRLDDGREVVVKARQDERGRAGSCVAAQRALAEAGKPVARPVTPAVVEAGRAVHAEEWRPGGDLLRGDSEDVAVRCAVVLAELMAALALVDVPPPLPNPYWLDWDHGGPGLWPSTWFLDERDQSAIPPLVVDAVTRATARLRASGLPCVLGHADFEAQNLRWSGSEIVTVHDWDSLGWMPEAAFVGAASGAFASAETPTLAPVASSAAFLSAYQDRRRRTFTSDEVEVAWAASLWPAGHNARGEALFGNPPVAGARLAEQAAERLRLAGA